jgi:hypothetical protein
LNKALQLNGSTLKGRVIKVEEASRSTTASTTKDETQPKEKPGQNTKEATPEEDNECKVCMDDAASVAFIPCGHVAVCKKCSTQLKKCPICRQDIQSTLVLYKV